MLERIKDFLERIRKFLREVRGEFKKISWPSRNEIFALTALVLIMVIILAIYISGVDAVFQQIFKRIIGG